eukprot:2983585-Rhodomonas_salina.1
MTSRSADEENAIAERSRPDGWTAVLGACEHSHAFHRVRCAEQDSACRCIAAESHKNRAPVASELQLGATESVVLHNV